MKLQLDTDKKTIKIDESVKLTKLMQVVKKLLPNGEWQDFTLITNTVIEHWSSPIIYKEYYPTPNYYWWQQPWYNPTYINVGTGTNTVNGTSGGYSNTTLSHGHNTLATGKNDVSAESSNTLYELKSGVYNIQV